MSESNSQDRSALRIAMLKQYLAEDPDDEFSQYALALEYEKNGNLTDAIAQLQMVLDRNPDYLAAYYQLGKLFEAVEDNKNAATVYEKGIAVAQCQQNIKTLNELRSALDLLD